MSEIFKKGDIVEAYGIQGFVDCIDPGSHYPIKVIFISRDSDSFKYDGLAESWHKTPSLKLVSRPKKKVTKAVTRWLNVSVFPDNDGYWTTKESADIYAEKDRVACVKLTGTYEVEEDINE